MSFGEAASKVSLFKKSVMISFSIVMILSYLIAMILGPLIFFFTEEGSHVAISTVQINFFLVGSPYALPMEVSAGACFILCWVIYCAAFLVSYVSGERFHRFLRKPGSYEYGDLTRNFLFSMPIITSLLYTLLVILVIFQVAFGVVPGPTFVSREPSDLMMFFNLTYSPVFEEIGYRLIPIGLFTITSLSIIARKKFRSKMEFLKMAFLGFLSPDKAKETAGVKSVHKFGPLKGIAVHEWMIVLLTSGLFGFAHYYFGAWTIGKIMTASIFGVTAALAYLVYGMHAPILLHWWFNYYFEAYSQAHYLNLNIPWVSFIVALWLTVLIAGSIGWTLIGHGTDKVPPVKLTL
jgi:hypothetical protein